MAVKKITHIVISVLFIVSCISGALPVRQASADVGPAQINPQGGSLISGSSSTNVELEYEKVTLTYGKPQRMPYYGSYRDYMPVHVTGVFWLKNTGSTGEKLDVYFPASDYLFVGGYNEMENQITNFKVDDGSGMSSGAISPPLTTLPTDINGKTQSMPVYHWQENFNGGISTKRLFIEYDTTSAKSMNVYYLTYVLGTGRGWKGPIGKADITFVMPQNITNDLVISKAPLIEENKLPYKVSGNSINFTLTEYEPEANDAIALGIYDLDAVNAIEELKKQPNTLENTIKIANSYRSLSVGAHCIFCTGSAAQQAKNYYSAALDKAKSKEELNTVLRAFAYGDSTYPAYNTELIFSYFTLAKDPDCKIGDGEFSCSNADKEKQLNDTYAIYIAMADPSNYKDVLTKYSCKIRAYDKASATAVDAFLGSPSDCSVKKATTQTTTSKNDTKNTADDNKRLIIITSAAVLVTGLVAVAVFMIIRKRRRTNAKDTAQPTEKPSKSGQPKAQ